MDKNHKYWIDYLKFIACLCVFGGHFFEVFIYKNEALADYENIVRCLMKSFLNGNFWVAVFCIISGYCIGTKRIMRFSELIKYYAKRYIRFVLPLMVALIFIVLLNKVISYRTAECASMLQGLWGGIIGKLIFHLLSILNLCLFLVIHWMVLYG